MFSKSASHFKLFGFISFLFAGLISIIMSSCELGLGSAVDVQPPEIEISGPVANDIIYEKFVMSGKWSDDRNEISGISILLENTTTKKKFGPYNVAEENLLGNKWSYEINPLSENEKIPDGKYNATVTCTDKENHSTIATVAFTLDNTPPLVVLARPSTKIDSNSPDGYGCEFSLEGEAVDDNVITLVEVNVYDSETNELKKTVQLENVSKKIDRTVAVFGAEDKAYEEIYGVIDELEKAVQKKFYCEVVAYDEARRVPEVEGDKGNHSTCFYLESEVSKFIKQYKSSGFYEIIKGTYDSENDGSRTADEEASLNAVRAAIKENAITQASFSLDPRNNPRYTISSYSNFKELKGEGDAATPVLMRESAKFTNNNTVTVNLLSGLDEYYIIKDTIGISLIECDSNGVIGEGAKEIMLFAPYKNKAGEVIVDANGNPLVADPAARESRIKTTGSTYSVDVTIGTKYQPEMAIGKYYVFKSYGYDENGREIHNYANTDYGFKLVSANAKPEINLTKLVRKSETGNKESTSTSTVELSAAEKLVIYGTAKLDDLIPNLQFNLGLSTDLSGEETLLGKMKADVFAESGFECTIPEEWKNKKFVIRITAINPEEPEQKTSEKISVTWDCDGPVIGQAAVSPTVAKVENEVTKSYVNGVVNIKTSVSDAMNIVEKVEYAIAKAGEEEGTRTVVEDISGVGFDVDTTAWDDESGKGNAVVAIYATDSAGNETRRAVVLNIDQSTDQPVIELNNADSTLNSVDGIVGASHAGKTNNIFGTITNTVILGTISDDDGIDSIQVFVAPEGSDFPAEPKETFTVGGDKTKAIQAKVSDTEGKFKVRIVVSDSAKHNTGYNSAKTSDFLVAVDDGAPNFTISTDSGALQAANTAIPVKGKASDGASFVIQRYKEKECLTVLSSSITVDAEGSWEDTISREEVGETGKTFYYKAEDEFGQKTVLSFSYLLDAIMPGFSIKRIGPNEYNPALTGDLANSAETTVYVKAGDPLNISGEVWDTGDVNNRSGLQDYVFYKLIKQSDGEPEKNEAGNAYKAEDWDQSNKLTFTTTETEQRGTWTKAVDISSGYDDGEKYVLYIAAKDNSRNISAIAANPCQTVVIVPDSQGPVITGQSADKTQITLANNTQDIIIEAKITDAVSGVNKVELYEGDSAYKYEKTNVAPVISNTDSSYKITISAKDLLNGTHSLKIRATDKAGNYKDSDPINISVDIQAPSIGYVSGAIPTTLSGTKDVVNGIVKVSGLASDETKLHKIYWYIDNKDTATDDQKGEYVCLENESGSKNFTFEVDTRKFADGTHTFYVYAEDKSGNTSPASNTTFEVLQSTDNPVFALDSLNNVNYLENQISATNNVMKPEGKVTGTVTEDDGLVEVKFFMDEGKASAKTYTVNSFTNPKSYSFDIPLTTLFGVSSADQIVLGNHTIRIVATDNAGGYTTFNSVAYSAASTTTNVIHFGVDKGAPEIIGGGVEFPEDLGNHRDTNGVYYKNEAFTGTFTVKDDVSLLAVTATNGTTATAVETDATQQSFVFNVNPTTANTTEKFTLKFEAEDKFHQKNSVSYNVVFDFDKPSVGAGNTWTYSPNLFNTKYFKKENTLTISGKSFEDKTKGIGLYSGLKTAEYKIDDGSWQPASSFTESSGNWTVKLDANSIDEGEHKVYVRVTDLAGNISESQSVELICDAAAPVITATTNAGVFADTVTISGTVADTYLNPESLTYVLKKGGVEVTDRTGTDKPTFTVSSGNWTFTMPKGTNGAFDGEYTVDLSAKDLADHTGFLNGISFLLDTKNPEITITNPSDSSTPVSGTNRLSSLNNKFEGAVSDANLESVYYMISKNSPITDTEDAGWKSASNTATSWNIWENFVEGKTDTTDASGKVTAWSEGKYYINVFAKDKVGNKSLIASRYFEFDKNAPVVESFESTASMTNVDFTLSGTVVETNGISGGAKIQVKKDGTIIPELGTQVALTLEAGSTSRYTFSKPVALSSLSGDGDYTFSVIVTDVSAQTNEEKNISVKVDTTAPSISNIKNEDGTAVKEYYDALKTIKIKCDSSDGNANQSGLDSVKYFIAKGNVAAPSAENKFQDWDDTSKSGSSWLVKIDAGVISESQEGEYTIFIKATDKVGNERVSAPIKFIADTKEPVVTENTVLDYYGVKDGVAARTSVVISGTVTDTYFDSMEIEVKKGAANYPNATKSVTGGNWTVTLPVNVSTHENDGTYTVKATFKDKSGKSKSTSLISTSIDTTAPEIEAVTTLAEDGSTVAKVEDYKITGKAKDNLTNGLSSVKYRVDTNASATAETGDWKEATGTLNWNFYQKFVEGKTSSPEALCEGTYYLHVYAVDNAGNISDVINRKFESDFNKPVVSINPLAVSTSGKFTLSGTASDTRGIKTETSGAHNGKSVVKVEQTNPAGEKVLLEYEISSGDWTSGVTLPVLTGAETKPAEGLYSYKVTVEDEVGNKTTESSSQIRWDVSAPALNITSHSFDAETKESGWQTTNTLTLTGSASDATGVQSVSFKEGAADYEVLSGTTSWTKELSNLSQGPHTIKFKTVDTNGSAAEFTYVLNIDSEAPVMGTNSIKRGATASEGLGNGTSIYANLNDTLDSVSGKHKFTLSGSATDSYKLGSIVVKAVKDGVTKTLVNKTDKVGAETDDAWNWSTEVLLDSADSSAENYLSNGTWDFSVSVKDKAGTHTVVETFKVIIDTVNPGLTPTYSVPSSADPRNNSSVTVKPVAKDLNGSGVDSVSYVIVDSVKTETELNALATNLWETISGANRDSNTTKNISFADGDNYLYLKVIDKAGNYAYSAAYRAKVDKEAPVIVMGNPAAVACVNGSNDIDVADFEIEVKDERGTLQSGIKQVDVYIDSIADGNLIATSVTPEGGSADLSIDADGRVTGIIAKEKFALKNATFKIYVQVTDIAGNIAYTNTNIGIDKAAPDATIKTTAKNNIGNKNLTLEGTTYDLNGVASVKVEFQTGATTWKDVTESKANGGFGLTMGGSTAAWSFVIPTYDEATYKTTTILGYDADPAVEGHQTNFRVTVTDIAKNETQKTLTVTIDQDADRPKVELTNLSSNGQIIQTSTIKGIISDDDTWDDTCVFKIDSVNHTISEWRALTQTGTLTIDENGNFDYTPAVSTDGEKTMYFYIKDSVGTEFVTAAESNEVMDMAKIIYKGNNTPVDNDAVIKYTADTVNPAVKEMKVGTTAESVMSEITVVGGNRNSIQISVTALDAVGLSSARAEVNGKWYSLTKDETSLTEADTFNDLSQTEKPEVTIAANGKKAEFTSSAISIAGWTSGRYEVTFEVTDNAGRKSTSSGSFTIDNQGPQCEVTNFSNWADEQTGGISWDLKFTDYPNSKNAGIAKYGYLVLNDDYLDGSKKADVTKIKNYMSTHTDDLTGTTVSGVTIQGLPSVSSDDSNSKFKNISVVRKDVYNLPIYFYTVDKLGNENLESFTIIYNVFGGRPSTNVAYPAGTEENPQVMNGTIRLSGGAAKGTATGAGNVEKVFVQFDITKDITFDATDKEKVSAYTISGSENKVFSVVEAADVSVKGGAVINWDGIGGSSGFWGIDVSGTNPSNWYKVINENLEFQNDDTLIKEAGIGTGVYRVAVRAVTLASDGVFGAWSPVQYFNIDTNIPEIKQDAKIIGDSTSDYVQDMYVKGDAKLQIVTVDKLDVTKVMVYTADSQAGLNDAAKATIKTLDLTKSDVATRYTAEPGKKGYTINVPLPTAASNKSDVYIKVVAYKENEASAYREYHINFDNTAPKINNFQFNSKDWESADESTHKIVNSNGKFTISGSTTDESSGYDKVGFYFIRGDVNDVSKYRARIYDPMSVNKEILVKAKDGTDLTLAEKEFGVASVTLGSSAQKMYGAEYTGASISEVLIGTEKFSQITLSDSVNENIKKAGYVEVGGNFYKIDKVESATKKITLTTNVPVINGNDNATVFFPFMQFVENTGSEKTDEDGLGFTSYPESDDGDGMPESIIKSQRTWSWDASIQSTNIPDGPGTMVVFVWDKAGNVSAASYACSVQNNAPRLVKLHLGTDLTGDNKFSDSEFVTYDVLNQDGRQSAYSMSTSSYKGTSFRVKDKLAVVPEFVGGNYSSGDRDIKMVLNRGADSETKNTVNSIATGNKIKDAEGDTTNVLFTDKKSGTGSILAADCSLVANRGYTDIEGVSVQNNIWAFLVDNYNIGTESPDADVNNGVGHRNVSFTFWDSTDDTVQGSNSCYMYLKLTDLIVDIEDNTPPVAKIHPFYWNSWTDSSVALDTNDLPRGHIDLEADLGSTKPAVAGAVLFRGSAYDATKVSRIYVKEPDAESSILVGQWNATNGEWEKVSTDWPEGWEDFEVTDDSGITLDGQTIEFTFKMNMTKYGVANGKTLYVYAEDGNSNKNSDDELQTNTVSETNKYIVNCVPYIQKLAVVDGTTETQLSRSRLGRYVGAAKAGRKLRIYGMNFTSTATYTVNFYQTNAVTGMKGAASTKVASVTEANVTKANGYIDVAMPEYSCWVEVVVGTGDSAVTTPNNTNANKKYNITKGTLNESTGKFKDGENFWTDDVYLSIWSTGGYMDRGDNPLSGTLEKFTGNGTKYVSKQGKTVNENDIFAIWGSNDQMLFDEVYYSGSTDAAQVSHVRGTSVCNSADGFFKTPPTKVDVCMANNIPFYVILDNGLVNGNTWGQGLLIMREGYYMQDAQNGAKKYAIESQGNGNALSRDSSDGMDEHNNQFDNPKIAVHFDGNNYHIYTCYYDTYSRCLKYSKHIDQKNLDINYTNMTSPMRTWDNPTKGYSVVDGYDTVQNNFNGSTWDCGAWSDIKLKVSSETDSNPIPVIAYYDKYNHCLKVAKGASTAPKTGRVDGALVAGGSATAWTYSSLKNPANCSDFGRYVSMEMDSAGGLHIVAQDVTNSVLCYGYVPYANLISGEVTVDWQIIDSTSAVGRWTDIKLGNPSGTGLAANPYIVYMDAAKLNTTSAVKVAYATNYTSQKKNAGGSYGTVTQNVWECMTDPAVYEAEDTKLSLVLDAKEKAGVTNKVAIGINASMFAVDFLRDEE